MKTIDPRWRVSVGVLLLGVVMSLSYGYGWRLGLPLELRNLAGFVLFACIMLGAGVAYAGARLNGANPWLAAKIGLLFPLVWHLKEMWLAVEIYGLGSGIYAGLQGFYPFYYCLVFAVMGVAHLGCGIYGNSISSAIPAQWRYTAYSLLPLLTIVALELLGLVLLGTEIFFFEGYLAGYRTLFM